jgi:1,2-phenylacetyl-CoA epoxidase PaaB subunit
MDTQSCPNCKSPEITAALTMGRFAYLRCSECTSVWSIRDRRESLPASTQPYRGKERRVARESPVIHDNVRLST